MSGLRGSFLPICLWFMMLHTPAILLAAACCGGGASTANLITGDDRQQMSTALSRTVVTVDNVDAEGFWYESNEHQTSERLKIEYSHILSDLWQAGISTSSLTRKKYNESFSGLGDTQLFVGHETLTNWDYNAYQPRGFSYFQVILPTGKSPFESEVGGLDSRDQGLWGFGAGFLAMKGWSRWDVQSGIEIHRYLTKNISHGPLRGTLKPGWGGSFNAGLGYSWKDYRFGASAAWTHEDPMILEGKQTSKKEMERMTTALLSAAYTPNDQWTASLSFADQTLLGEPRNTSLGQIWTANLQRRWPR